MAPEAEMLRHFVEQIPWAIEEGEGDTGFRRMGPRLEYIRCLAAGAAPDKLPKPPCRFQDQEALCYRKCGARRIQRRLEELDAARARAPPHAQGQGVVSLWRLRSLHVGLLRGTSPKRK